MSAEDWDVLTSADCREKYPTKGAMQDGLKEAVREVDALLRRLAAVEAERDDAKAEAKFIADQFATMKREKEHGWYEAEIQETRAEEAEAERDATHNDRAQIIAEHMLDRAALERVESLARGLSAFQPFRPPGMESDVVHLAHLRAALRGDQ